MSKKSEENSDCLFPIEADCSTFKICLQNSANVRVLESVPSYIIYMLDSHHTTLWLGTARHLGSNVLCLRDIRQPGVTSLASCLLGGDVH